MNKLELRIKALELALKMSRPANNASINYIEEAKTFYEYMLGNANIPEYNKK